MIDWYVFGIQGFTSPKILSSILILFVYVVRAFTLKIQEK